MKHEHNHIKNIKTFTEAIVMSRKAHVSAIALGEGFCVFEESLYEQTKL